MQVTSHRSRDFTTTEPKVAFDPACAERGTAAIDRHFKEFSRGLAVILPWALLRKLEREDEGKEEG